MLDVRKDRDKYIGGSDVPIIMGLSPFKTRWELLLEKAGIAEDEFEGNEYTHFGEALEPTIRDYVNDYLMTEFKEEKVIDGARRYHADGYADGCVLEIKTTSRTHEKAEDYKAYMAQLEYGMDMFRVSKGILAVYERPANFDTEFDPLRLRLFPVERDEALIKNISTHIELFIKDLEFIKTNPLATEAELPSTTAIVPLAEEIMAVEARMNLFIEYKALEKEYNELRAKLKGLMTEAGIETFTANNGTKFTLVADGKDKEIEVFNEGKFKEENPFLWEAYTEKAIKKGRAGYVRITAPRRD